MQFKLMKELKDGRFFVRAVMTEFTTEDGEKTKKFGIPTLTIRLENGGSAAIRVNLLERYNPFGFYKQEEADQYALNLREQIITLKHKWDSWRDTWSNEETI